MQKNEELATEIRSSATLYTDYCKSGERKKKIAAIHLRIHIEKRIDFLRLWKKVLEGKIEKTKVLFISLEFLTDHFLSFHLR